jgi:eukaryotic-like serine/threonine-protein kinase
MSADLQATLQDMLGRAAMGDGDLSVLKGYTLARKLGEGGMGAVFLVHHGVKGDAAVKLIRPDLAVNEMARKLFQREIANAMSLRHDNIVGFHGAGDSRGVLFLLMDFCNGGSVAARMARAGGRLPLAKALDITAQALDGLVYAHSAPIDVALEDGSATSATGLVHRDLKPDNLFLTTTAGGETVRIGDYGLAKAFQTAGLSGMTLTGEARGTPEFMPRHQVIDFKYAGPEVDVWAIAASLYNMLTGRFPRNVSGDRWRAVLRTAVVPIRERENAIPSAVAAVIDRALDDSQDELLFRSAGDLQSALRAAIS